jgi:tetratricopeptide (TPR) repeat protein
MAVTLAVYWQAGRFDFIHFDDNLYVTQNPHVSTGFSLSNMLWAFTSVDVMYWHPLTLLSHMLDVQLYGMNPHGHHATNIIVHMGSTALLLYLLFRLTGTVWQSLFVAALFALHPLHVESVAWVAERKDVLSAFFWFLTLLSYAAFVEKPTRSRYLFTFASFVLGLMAKPMVVTLPVVMLLLDFWPLNRSNLTEQGTGPGHAPGFLARLLPLVKEKIPFFACSLLLVAITIYSQLKMGGMPTVGALSLGLRIENALVSYLTYIAKTVWPHDLAILYPLPAAIPLWHAIGAFAILLLASAATIRFGRQYPYLPVGWFWFLITLLPVIGFTQAGVQAMADRFTYIPHIGLFLMVAWGIPPLLEKISSKEVILALLAGGVLTASAAATWHQLGYWRDEAVLYQHALRVTASNHTMHANLGGLFLARGDLEAALGEYREALALSPTYADAHYNLGVALARKGDLAEAIREFRSALALKPGYADAHNNLGVVLARGNEHAEAMREYRAALAINPSYADAHNNLGIAFASRGELDAALAEYRAVLVLRPDDAAAHNNLGEALAGKGDLAAAIAEYEKALALAPDLTEARTNLQTALALRRKQ